MALVIKDRVRQTSTTAGTGTITLSGSVTGYQDFTVIGTGNTTYYTIADQSGSNWEVGIGTYTSPNQLSRGTILASSNAGAIVNFGAGTKDVFVTLPAEEAVYLNGQNIYAPNAIVSKNIITVDDTAASGYTAVLGVDANGYAVIGGGSSLFGAINQSILAPAGLQLGDSNTAVLTLNAAPTAYYGLNFPPAAGSNNQLLKTDGAGNLGWMDLGSPPAIGGTTPNAITGTTVTVTGQEILTNPAVPTNYGWGVIECVDDGIGDFYNDLRIYAEDQFGTKYAPFFNAGVSSANFVIRSQDWTTNYQYVQLNVPSGMSTSYTLTLPTTAGSNNQVLKTDGSGNLSWLDLGSPPAIGSTTPNTGAFTTLTTTGAVTTTAVSDPSAPVNGNLSVYAKSFGGNVTLAARNALNASFGLQSALWSKNFQMWTTTAAAAGLWVNATGTGSGTYTNVNPTAGATKYQSCRRSTYANLITTTNQVLGVANGQTSFFRGSTAGLGGFFYYARVGFDVWTNGGRFFAGMAQATTVVSADPSALNNTVGFCVDAADNGAISFLTRGTAATKASTGFTIVSNKGYDCYIYCSPNSSQYTWQIIDINTGTSASGTATLNLPTNTAMQAPEALASNAALTPATSISIGVCKIYVESDN